MPTIAFKTTVQDFRSTSTGIEIETTLAEDTRAKCKLREFLDEFAPEVIIPDSELRRLWSGLCEIIGVVV